MGAPSSSVSSGSAPHTWTRPSMAVTRQVSVGWKDSDWTTALPTGSFKVRDPWRSEKQKSSSASVHVLVGGITETPLVCISIPSFCLFFCPRCSRWTHHVKRIMNMNVSRHLLPPGPSSRRVRPQSSSGREYLYWTGSSPAYSPSSYVLYTWVQQTDKHHNNMSINVQKCVN